jgi:hypothetical protein
VVQFLHLAKEEGNLKKRVLLLAALLAGLVAGCDGGAADEVPTPTAPTAPTSAASPTPAAEVATATSPPAVITPSGPAACTVEPLEFPVNPEIPPIAETEVIHGPAEASISFVEYADFQ